MLCCVAIIGLTPCTVEVQSAKGSVLQRPHIPITSIPNCHHIPSPIYHHPAKPQNPNPENPKIPKILIQTTTIPPNPKTPNPENPKIP